MAGRGRSRGGPGRSVPVDGSGCACPAGTGPACAGSVDRVLDQVAPDGAVVEQRVALARCPVADDPPALGTGGQQEAEQIPLDVEHRLGEAEVPGEGVQPGLGLRVQHRLDVPGGLTRRPGRPGVHPQGTAVRGQLLDVGHDQARGGQRPLRGTQRQVLVVLVVDGVVLPAFDQPQQVRELAGDQAGRLDQGGQPGGEADQVRHVGVHVVGNDQVGPAETGGQLGAGGRAQEPHLGADAPGPGHLGDVAGRFHPEHRDATRHEMLEQISVVARHLGHQALRAESEGLGHGVGVPLGVRHPGVGIGREIGVVGENLLSGHVRRQLHQ